MGLADGLLYGANGTFASINHVSGVPRVSSLGIKMGLMLLQARHPSFCELRLIELKLNLDHFVFDFQVDLWLVSALTGWIN